MKSETDAPFFQTVLDHIAARADWNTKDTQIQKRRLGDRPRKRNTPYLNAPNFVSPVVDENVSQKTDDQISRILNAPSLCVPIPIPNDRGQTATPAQTSQLQKWFDTYLRHIIRYRPKTEQCADTTNERGFGVTLTVRSEHERFGVIPDFEPIDPKDVIPPWDTKCTEVANVDGLTYVLRLSPRELRQRRDQKGWNNVDTLLAKLEEKGEDGEVQQSAYDDDEHSSQRATQQIVGISKSDLKGNKIVIWAHLHYATKWTVEYADNPEVKLDRKVICYLCPDEPSLILKCVPWKREDKQVPLEPKELAIEQVLAQAQMRPPQTTRLVEGKDKPWPIIQHRYEYRKLEWYDTRGLGQLLMDNQIKATALENAEGVILDYTMNPMFKRDESADVNAANIKIKPGGNFPRGVDFATTPQPPQILQFLQDRERRIAAKRAGTSGGMYSGQVTESRKLEKTATEVHSENAQQGLVTSASVERFNDPERELFQQLWEDMKELRPNLPIIDRGEYVGQLEASIYDLDFIMVPAASAKTSNPELQFQSNAQLAAFFEHAGQLGVPFDARATAIYVGAMANPDMTKIALPDPAKPPTGGEIPFNMRMQKVEQTLQATVEAGAQLQEGLESTQKLALETDDKVQAVQGDQENVAKVFDAAGIPRNGKSRPAGGAGV